jgi:predicted nucleotidyltransferase
MASLQAPDFSRFIARLARTLEEHGLPFMLIGGQAVLLHGRPRLTEDIDVTLGVAPDQLPAVLAVSGALGLEPLPRRPEEFVRATFVLPASDPPTGLRVDFIFSTTPYERQAIARALHVTVAGVAVPFATAEDLILHKLFAGRALDWEDAIGVVRRTGNTMDWEYLRQWADEFATVPGREDLPARLSQLREEA